MKKLIILTILVLLVSTPVSAKIIESNVDDKEIVDTYGQCFTIHTVDFGDINVDNSIYNKVMIGDNITFSTESSSFGYYTVYRINGELIGLV